jgi:hypothetical protein
MKKLFTHTQQTFWFSLLILFCIGLNSCKKDFNSESSSNYNSNFSHKISQAEIQKWAVENPVVKYLALDYKNAKQGVFRGKMVVKIPLLNENKFPFNNPTDKKVESNSKTFNAESPKIKQGAYFAQHPPEVFLVKDDKDSLHSALLNFIPDNQAIGFGQNGIWTGKLYEWNMNSDSIFVRRINQNNIIERLILKKVNQSSELGNSNIKSDSFWNFLRNIVDAIGEFFNDVGFFLGIPGSFGFFPGEGWGYIEWGSSSINEVGGDYGGGGGGGSNFGSGGSSFDFYNYWFPTNGGGGNYQSYPIEEPVKGGPSVPSDPIPDPIYHPSQQIYWENLFLNKPEIINSYLQNGYFSTNSSYPNEYSQIIFTWHLEVMQEINYLSRYNDVYHMGWSNYEIVSKAFWHVASDQLHFVLDIAGFVPVFGAVPDLLNASFYFLEGNNTYAALSVVAAIPVIEWIIGGTKIVLKSVKVGKKGAKLIALSDKAGNLFTKIVKRSTHSFDASIANQESIQKMLAIQINNPQAPYAAGLVEEFVLHEPAVFVRAINPTSEAKGTFLMDFETFQSLGMSANNIEQSLALFKRPDKLQIVTLPAGTTVRKGIAKDQVVNGVNLPGGGVQYEVMDDIDQAKFIFEDGGFLKQ